MVARPSQSIDAKSKTLTDAEPSEAAPVSQVRIARRELETDSPLESGMHPVLDRIYRSRGVTSADELDLSLGRLLPFSDLSGIDDAVELLRQALAQNKRILFIGDFDADGATSCAVGVRALRAMGASQVSYLVPNRFEFGYGLTPELVAVAAEQQPDILVTVDNGISSHEGVDAANALGIDVLITDHHLPAETLPSAAAIVNPNVAGDVFSSKSIAGVGVIFYVMIALRAKLRAVSWFDPASRAEPNLGELLDFVALGTVADVVSLDRNNRVLVSQGLARIRAGRCHPGIQALLEVGGRELERVTASDLSFAVAPRLNAAGRLDDMALGIECLLSDDAAAAARYAQTLDQLNRERREIEATMRTDAEEILASVLPDESAHVNGLCLFDERWHSGVVGILAGRLKERFNRPTIVFAPDPMGGLKGSARSVKGVHIRDVLDSVASKNPGLIDKFGGHAMAAGVTLAQAKFEAFREAFDAEIANLLDGSTREHLLLSDGALAAPELSCEFAERLRSAGPWGQAFAEPIFDDEFRVQSARRVGSRHIKLRLCVRDGTELDAIAFNALSDDDAEVAVGPFIHAAYRLDVDTFRGNKRLQLIVEHFTSAERPQLRAAR